MKKVIVSQRVDAYPERQENRDALDQQLAAWLLAAGYLAYPLPNGLTAEGLLAWLQALAPQGVVLSGGNDVGSLPERDLTEAALLDFAQARQLPVLGICRGMQFLAVRAGAVLTSVTGHVAQRHVVVGEIQRAVNSFHGQAVAACPPGFRVLATSEDGCLEAMAHLSLPWEGWMWHPERERPFVAEDLQRLQRLLGDG